MVSRSLDGEDSAAYTSWDGDYLPPRAAFRAAALIWIFIVSVVVLFGVIQNRRERELVSASGCGGCGDDQSRTGTGGTSRPPSEGALDFDREQAVRQTVALDARYNLQTLALALVQASFSMLILGGSQIDFRLTWIVVFGVVAAWTFLFGALLAVWMSRGAVDDFLGVDFSSADEADSEGAAGFKEEALLQSLSFERGLLFLRHYVVFTLFRPMSGNSDRIVARDIYQDFGRDASRTFLLGIGQMILLSMYIWSIVDDGRPDFSDERTYKFYCLGIFLQVAYVAGKDVLYQSTYNHLSFWGNVLRAARRGACYEWTPPEFLLYHRPRMAITGSVRGYRYGACVRLRNSPFLWFRFLLSTAVNVGGLSIITLLLPMQLASNDEPLRFVLSAVGAYYILAVDDYGEPVIYNLVPEMAAVDLERGGSVLEKRAVHFSDPDAREHGNSINGPPCHGEEVKDSYRFMHS